MACGLALLASGQAFAASYSRVGSSTIADTDLTNGTMWIDNATTCGMSPPAAVGGTIAMTNADTVIICVGHSLNLTTAATFSAGTLVFELGAGGDPSGTWIGARLQFSAGSKTISNGNTSLPAIALDISSMAIGDTITIGTNPVTFSSITPNTKGLECPTGTPYTPGSAVAAPKICSVVAVTVTPSVSAPIFSTKEKPAVFSEEVK